MKKLITSLTLLICVFVNAQEIENNFSEIKLNTLSASLGTIEVEFERTINSKSSVGLSLFTTFDDSGQAFSYDYGSGITGFYRYYLGKKYASGIFFEGFGMLHNTRYPSNNSQRDINTNLLAGLGIGYKWISKKGIIIQANFSPGINIFNDEFETISGRAGISIGYRF
ncbi:DUF3575 domain-containing protein [Subsaximicrobium wynnwilliamsii]|uniref:DUF3575 domain-containing protein n=1 Tax=Subsaximicrobium wynnwilliamsii TaxID=291179 RepID=A0A5C6ZFN6_9FLAO|nr:DUF3575 domain-containing protein [Subsaximicrobium wynnwilliamsii]TXD82395.1 DUF3575 domain-containing protein [Subsaximicrobium wynnwilliamsii]TXD88037.1 DUF3575 domain-containing protein [Subsaximicrobium wynnwilliamsii]TXE02101.1 DUF3575 domain-containing protein [Subsaximicrobium wynnwilliamsii]